MKEQLNKIFFLSLLIYIVLVSLSYSATVEFSPSSQNVLTNTVFSVYVVISIDSSEYLHGAKITVQYDATKLTATSVSPTSSLSAVSKSSIYTSQDGEIGYVRLYATIPTGQPQLSGPISIFYCLINFTSKSIKEEVTTNLIFYEAQLYYLSFMLPTKLTNITTKDGTITIKPVITYELIRSDTIGNYILYGIGAKFKLKKMIDSYVEYVNVDQIEWKIFKFENGKIVKDEKTDIPIEAKDVGYFETLDSTTKKFIPINLAKIGKIYAKYSGMEFYYPKVENEPIRIVYNLSGRIKYANRDGSENIDVPKGIKAKIIAEGKECIIGSNGTYSFEKLFNPKFEIKLEPKLDKIKIVKTVTPEEILDISVNAKVDEIKGGKYVYYNETQQKFIVDVVLDKSNGNRAAFNILKYAKMGYEYASDKGLTQSLKIVWYPGNKLDNSYYSADTIYLQGGDDIYDTDEWDESVILHEVGHFGDEDCCKFF